MGSATAFAAAMVDAPVIAIIRLPTAGAAVHIADAIHREGIQLIEVTLTTQDALAGVEALRELGLDALSVGVGSVRTVGDATRALDAGAEYLVTPTVEQDVIQFARGAGVPIVCGGLTPTELDAAHRAGADYVKLFPASAVGPRYLRDVLAPMPDLRVVPTGGVKVASIPEFRAAGAVGVGIGSDLVDAATVEARDWPELRRRARSLLAAWHGT